MEDKKNVVLAIKDMLEFLKGGMLGNVTFKETSLFIRKKIKTKLGKFSAEEMVLLLFELQEIEDPELFRAEITIKMAKEGEVTVPTDEGELYV